MCDSKLAAKLAAKARAKIEPTEDLAKIAESFGGEVVLKDFWDTEDTTSLVIEPSGRFRAFIDSNAGPLGQRFELAHELGHWFFYNQKHGKKKKVPASIDRYGNREDNEEANVFAAEFLIPGEELKKKFKELHGDLWALSEHFLVPIWMVSARITAYGLSGKS